MKNLLFPHRFQKPALVGILLFGALSFISTQFNFELSFLAAKPLGNGFLDGWSNNNLTDELGLAGLLLSLTVYGFCREKDEDEYSINMRFNALVWAVLLHTFISLLLIMLVYGISFTLLAVMHLFTVLLLYVFIYKTRRFITRFRMSRA